MDVDDPSGFVWLMRWMCKSIGHRIGNPSAGHVRLLATVRSAKPELRSVLLDAFAVHSVLGAGSVARTEFLQMVQRAAVDLLD